jgi:hypothetical protein
MATQRPRSVALPMALTLLVLLGLTVSLARFDERFTVRITKPAATPTPILKRAVPVQVEGIADPGDARYRRVMMVILKLYELNAKYGKTIHDSTVAKYDPDTRTFAGTITVSTREKKKNLFLNADVIDSAGRHHDEYAMPVWIE